jgi:hypothetical protein
MTSAIGRPLKGGPVRQRMAANAGSGLVRPDSASESGPRGASSHRGDPMKKKFKLALAGSALACLAQTALCAPALEATSLYKDVAHDCKTLDLKQWSHPTRRVLDHAHVELRKVELCNHDLYPIFTVRFTYDPMMGPNDKYFSKLYADMFAANGSHPFSLVDYSSNVVVQIEVTGKKEISVSYEEFSPPGNP